MAGADSTVGRRGFLRAAAGAGGAAAAAGAAAAQDGVDYGGWFEDVSNFDGTVDRTGQDEVSVSVGAQGNNGPFAFDPPAVRVDPGTTVVWEWTGEGGQHNVVHEGGDAFQSDRLSDPGATFEHTFEEEGIFKYFCDPHLTVGMKGAVVVGQPEQQGGEEAAGPVVPDAARSLTVAALVGMLATLGLAFVLIKYGEAGEPEV